MSNLSNQNGDSTQLEQGFALYMAIGFIVLITVLAGSVGNTLNTAIIAELRQGDSRKLLDEAETALSAGWARSDLAG